MFYRVEFFKIVQLKAKEKRKRKNRWKFFQNLFFIDARALRLLV